MKILTTLIVASVASLAGYRVWESQSAMPPKSAVAHSAPAPAPASVAAAIPDLLAGTETLAPIAANADSSFEILPADKPAVPDGVEFEENDLITAVEQGVVKATLRANGHDRAIAKLNNNSPTPLRVIVPAGQILENGRNLVIVLRAANVELMPGQSGELPMRTAALHSANVLGDAPFKLSYQESVRVLPFIKWLGQHPEVSTPAAQTAILALSENLPLNALAKFAPASGAPARLGTDAFRVEAGDLIASLAALRDSGAKMEGIVLAADPQLRIEAMIEPLSREAAKRYYGITEETEWEFWKHELLEGAPGTRHYALFGIARFYPDIALEMLPKWAREPKTHAVYRMSAIQALADTQRPEALVMLRQIAEELGADSDLGKAATQAAGFLDQRLNQLSQQAKTVAFRGSATVGGF
jgi:hypothetical protein